MFKTLMNKLVHRYYHLILNENDVISTLKVINKHHKVVPDMAVGNCGWNDTSKWFIHFYTTESKWEEIRKELRVIRVFNYTDIPEENNGNVYTMD